MGGTAPSSTATVGIAPNGTAPGGAKSCSGKPDGAEQGGAEYGGADGGCARFNGTEHARTVRDSAESVSAELQFLPFEICASAADGGRSRSCRSPR